MSKKIFQIIIFHSLLLLCFTNAWSQTVIYEYDNAGNRTGRYVFVLRMTDTTSQDTANTAQIQDSTLQDYADHIKDSLVQTTALLSEKIGDIKVSVFPNPTNGKLTLKASGIEEYKDAEIFIYNESGVLLSQTDFNKTEKIIDFSAYSTGNYYLKVMINNADKTFKIVKTY